MKHRRIKMSQFGTYAKAQQINACAHHWQHDPVRWWTWGKAELCCTECGTRKKARE